MDNDGSQNNAQRKNPLKVELEQSVQERINKYKAEENSVIDYLKRNPDAPKQRQETEKKYIAVEVEKLEGIFNEVAPYILKIRERISSVLDQNKLTASYFLFGKIFHSWQALFLLAREGFNYEVMELLRSISEAADLMAFFMRGDDSSPDLKKWFAGEIVSNEKARKSIDDFTNKEAHSAGIALPVGEMKAGIYGGLSKYTHVSYGALLDSFNVFSRDFDFDRVSGFHYTHESSLPYANGAMRGLIVSLKFFYQSVGDNDSFNKLDLILRKVAPEMFDTDRNKRVILETIKRYSKS
jgi:hypothetical protein